MLKAAALPRPAGHWNLYWLIAAVLSICAPTSALGVEPSTDHDVEMKAAGKRPTSQIGPCWVPRLARSHESTWTWQTMSSAVRDQPSAGGSEAPMDGVTVKRPWS